MASITNIYASMDPTHQSLFIQFFNSLPEISKIVLDNHQTVETLYASKHVEKIQRPNKNSKKPATTIRFFNRIEYYTVHGSDASFVANEVFRTKSFIKEMGSGKNTLESLIVNRSQFESLLKDLLLVKQYRVEVYTNKVKNSPTSWNLEFKGSPGNISQFEELLFSNNDQVEGAATLGIKYDTKTKKVGVALVDMVEHVFSLAEFSDDEHFTNLEGLIVHFGPKECILPAESSIESDNIKKVADRCGVLVTVRKKAEFSSDDLAQDLNRLIKFEEGQQPNANSLPEMSYSVATTSLAGVIKYLELCSDSDNFEQFVLKTLELGRFVHLDSAALSALNIISSRAPSQGPANTLLSLLDKCRTSHGHRLLGQWIKQPLKDLNVISERHDIVETLANESVLRQSLYDEHLQEVPDFQLLSKKLQKKKANMQDCYRIYQGIEKLPYLISSLETYSDEGPHPTLKAVFIDPIKEHVTDMEKFQEMILSTLDMSQVDNGEFLVKPDFDEDLQALREKMDECESDMKAELERVAQDLSLEANKHLKLDSNSQYGYFFRVSLKDEAGLRKNKKYIQLDATNSGLRFRSEELTSVNEEYVESREKYTKHQQTVVAEVVGIAVGYCSTLCQISRLLAMLDVLCSFAVVSACAPKPYVRPVMKSKGSGVLKLEQARHPCLERLDSVFFIPNDVEFNNDCRFYVITGPNMGGKSTYIRSIGTVVLLAQIGCLVPCDSAEISVVDSILARVGANDSQLKGMSTFMVEMVETASILKSATKDSLVIIDELGRGTSTYEGCGIAFAISEYLACEVKACCLFATHFHELTGLPDRIPTIRNLHVTAHASEEGLTLLYQVKPGACDQSFGIEVATMSRFPDRIIQDAKQTLAELEHYQSSIVTDNDVQKRKIVQEGHTVMKEVLDYCKQLSIDTFSPEELNTELEKLRQKVLSKNNSYLNILMDKSVPIF